MRVAIWLQAARVRTLPAALAPVMVGWALAARAGAFDAAAATLCALGALLIQVGTNYANDYFDALKGADTDERVGPLRATAAGLVTPSAMRTATVVTMAAAAVVGGTLVMIGGWPIAVIGVLSIAMGVLYTGGPTPLGYLGLGDILVLIFFGPVAVAGTAYVQIGALDPLSIYIGLGPGLISTAILVVNNLRDRHTDVCAGKRTLAVRFGGRFARLEYAAVLALAFALPIPLALTVTPGALLAFLALPFALSTTAQVCTKDGAALNPLLGGTARVLLVYSAGLALGWAFL